MLSTYASLLLARPAEGWAQSRLTWEGWVALRLGLPVVYAIRVPPHLGLLDKPQCSCCLGPTGEHRCSWLQQGCIWGRHPHQFASSPGVSWRLDSITHDFRCTATETTLAAENVRPVLAANALPLQDQVRTYAIYALPCLPSFNVWH